MKLITFHIMVYLPTYDWTNLVTSFVLDSRINEATLFRYLL